MKQMPNRYFVIVLAKHEAFGKVRIEEFAIIDYFFLPSSPVVCLQITATLREYSLFR